jgi:hypothetical protein
LVEIYSIERNGLNKDLELLKWYCLATGRPGSFYAMDGCHGITRTKPFHLCMAMIQIISRVLKFSRVFVIVSVGRIRWLTPWDFHFRFDLWWAGVLRDGKGKAC